MKKGIDYIGVGVGAVIFNDKGQVFVNKRGKEARNDAGKWEFPGGGLDFMESFEDCIVREVKEEFDFEIEVIELIDVWNQILEDEKQHWVAPTMLARYKSGEPKIMEPHKCDGFEWRYLSELKDLDLSSISVHDVEVLLEKKDRFSKFIKYD